MVFSEKNIKIMSGKSKVFRRFLRYNRYEYTITKILSVKKKFAVEIEYFTEGKEEKLCTRM